MALILDVETIGLPERGCLAYGEYPPYTEFHKYDNARVVQCSMMVCNEKLEQVEMLDFVVRIDGFTIHNSQFHGITNEISLEKGIPFAEVAAVLSEKLKHVSHIIAHNANFDMNILKSELCRLNMHSIVDEMNSKQVLCSMHLTKPIVQAKNKYGKPKDPTLAELYAFAFGKPIEHAHDSKYDVINLHSAVKQLYDSGVLTFPKEFEYTF